MAVKKPTQEHINDDAMRITWAHIGAGDTCEPFSGMSEYADRSVSVFDAGGSGFNGGSITIQGSPNYLSVGANAYWDTLNSPSETPLNITSSKIRAILEYVESIRPSPNAVGDVTVILNVKRK